MEYLPGYVDHYHSGELERRSEALESRLVACDICPRECRVNRLEGEPGFCRSGTLPAVATVCAHYGEEPVLSGSRGSGTIFFAGCNMRCLYCQNHQISQEWTGQTSQVMDCHALAERMLYLQDELGCHNINLVSPSHFVPQIVKTVLEAVPMGLRLPLVYNTNAYDSIATLKTLDGIISIYLPDLRYASDDWAERLSQVKGYVDRARRAIREMYRQVGNLTIDGSGVAWQGLIVRHLILPYDLAGSEQSLTWLADELSSAVTVSIMSQYLPVYRAHREPLLGRTITAVEYEAVVGVLSKIGLKNGWVQEMGAAREYVPDFEQDDHPFSNRDDCRNGK
ncbi:radical SAM protein [Chloroflexota bacterium]